MNRNYYCKVNSQKEADELLKKLRDIGETTNNKYIYITNWQYIVYNNTTWALSNIKIFKEEFEDKIEVSASELIDYVTGKKLDKDALLEEAKRRYPVGTKFRCPAGIGVTGIHKIEIEDEIEFYGIYSNNIDISGKGYVYYNNQWAEIVKEPKVEYKFEAGKRYKLKYLFNGKPCNTLAKSTSDSINNLEFNEYYDLNNKKEFILPEKWCVKSTDEADETLIKWRGGTYGNRPAYLCSDKYWISENIYKAYTEITFDQFKKYVLKQEVKEEVKSMKEWSVGSYVVFLQTYGIISKKGSVDKIIKVEKKTCILEKEGISLGPEHSYVDKYLKWFPTLQEAQKFSDELLGKNKTELSVKDLIAGEIYIDRSNIIFMYNDIIGDKNPSILDNKFYKEGATISIGLSSPFKVYNNPKWLKTCIKQDKFIEQSELDKYDNEGNLIEFPEYVECIRKDSNVEIGVIYKVTGIKNWCESDSGCTKVYYLNISISPYYTDYFKPSTKEAYDAQFKKSEQFKNGDWLVYIKRCASIPIKIGDIKQMIKGKFGSLVIYGYEDLSQYFRKALPHEIPVENSVKQYPYTPEESIKLDFKIKWNSGRYFIGVDPVSDLKTTLSIDDEDLPMVIPSKEVKITNKLSID